MGLLDNYTGIGMSPRPKWQHQIVINALLSNTALELRKKHLLMLSEATVTDNWDDLAPDLVIFDEYFYPLCIIEIATHKELREIKNKCLYLVARFPDSEFFVFDYEFLVLYKYDTETDRWNDSLQNELYSVYLKLPLTEYLYLD